MGDVTEFTGATPQNTKLIYKCNNCESRAFKFVRRGASAEACIECANCETEMTGLVVFESD